MKAVLRPLFITLFAVALIWPTANINWGKDHWKGVLESDAKGYYAYLPAVFIYSDLNFGFYDSLETKKYYNPNLAYDYRYTFDGNTVNKYFLGTAFMQAPFFLLAHYQTKWFSQNDQDGYSKLYMIWLCMAAIFYCLLGLVYFLKSLELLNVSFGLSLFVGGVMIFGTNLFYYVVGEPGMSHIFSFALMSLLVFTCINVNQNKSEGKWVPVLLALLIIIRPVNGLALFIVPVLVSRSRIKGVLLKFHQFVIPIVLSLFIIGLQPLVYFIQTGNLFVYSYAEEGFNFLSPHPIDMLFSFKKGLFVYTPVLLFIIPAVFFFVRKDKSRVIPMIVFLGSVLYVFSSWWNWWYGGSFSQRVFIEYYPFFFLLIALWLNSLGVKVKSLVIGLMILLMAFNQFQTYQYRYNIIHWEDMNMERYKNVFLDFSIN